MTGPVDWQAEFAAHLDKLRGIAFNRLARDREREETEEAIAEVIAIAWKRWTRAIARGRDPRRFSTIIAKQAIADVRAGFTVSGGNRLTDALSHASRCRNGHHVDYLDDAARRDDGPFGKAILTGPGEDPGNAARAHLDWLAWTGRLCPRLYAVLVELVEGATTTEIAARHGWDRCHAARVRKQLARAWKAYGVDCE